MSSVAFGARDGRASLTAPERWAREAVLSKLEGISEGTIEIRDAWWEVFTRRILWGRSSDRLASVCSRSSTVDSLFNDFWRSSAASPEC